MIKKSEALKCISLLYEAYNRPIKEESREHYERIAEMWCICFENYQYEDIKKAIYEIIKESKYMPTIAEIREKTIRRLPDGGYIKDGFRYD